MLHAFGTHCIFNFFSALKKQMTQKRKTVDNTCDAVFTYRTAEIHPFSVQGAIKAKNRLLDPPWILVPNQERSSQGCILSLCLFNLYAEYIIGNARMDEAQARIEVARRNINSLRYSDDATLMAESKEELKSLLMRVKEDNGKSAFRTQDHGIWSHHFMANRWGNNGNRDTVYTFGLQNHCRWWLQPWN